MIIALCIELFLRKCENIFTFSFSSWGAADGWHPSLSTHWGWATHICVNEITIIVSDNGLLPGRCQAIICINAGILLIGPLRTNFNEILIKIHTFSFDEMHLKMSTAKWQPLCLSFDVLKTCWWSGHRRIQGISSNAIDLMQELIRNDKISWLYLRNCLLSVVCGIYYPGDHSFNYHTSTLSSYSRKVIMLKVGHQLRACTVFTLMSYRSRAWCKTAVSSNGDTAVLH